MTITIDIKRPHCHSANATGNGKKSKGKQNCPCKDCVRQFIGDHERACIGTFSWIKNMIKIMLARGVGVRDIGITLKISVGVGLKSSNRSNVKCSRNKAITIVLKQTSFGHMRGKRSAKYDLFMHVFRVRGKSQRYRRATCATTPYFDHNASQAVLSASSVFLCPLLFPSLYLAL
jgi:transposase-like protein